MKSRQIFPASRECASSTSHRRHDHLWLRIAAALTALVILPSSPGQVAPVDSPITHSESVLAGFFTVISPLVVEPVGATGTIESNDLRTLTDTDADFLGAFPFGAPLTLIVLNGSELGLCLQIESFTATTLTANQDLSQFNLVGASYELRQSKTVGSFFGDYGQPILGIGSSVTADLIYIPTESENPLWSSPYLIAYIANGGICGVGWRAVGFACTDTSTTPISPGSGIVIHRKAWPLTPPRLTLAFTGQPLTTPIRIPISTGFNPVSRISIDPISLAESRLNERLHPGTSATADLIWIPETDGSYSQYFWSQGGLAGTGWRKVGGGNADCANVPLSSAFFIQRRLGPTSIILPPPPR